jgi:hypothetical protein
MTGPQAMMASSLPAPTPEFQAILERLLMICSTGTLLELQDVLQNSPVIEVALAIQMHSLEAVQLPMHNLRLMLQEACQAGKASIVEFLLKFAKEHKISLDKLIWRQVVYSAIESNDLALRYRELSAGSVEIFVAIATSELH